jgi:hypothetical protein
MVSYLLETNKFSWIIIELQNHFITATRQIKLLTCQEMGLNHTHSANYALFIFDQLIKFIFYCVVLFLFLWYRSWIWQVNSSFFLISFSSFYFYLLILSWLRIRFHDLFCLFSIRLFRSHDSRILLNGLTWVDPPSIFIF